MSCSVCQHCVALPTVMAYTVPNYPNYNLGADSTSVCDTILNVYGKSDFEEISVYPNPATSVINIFASSGYTVTIYNLLGYLVDTKPDNSQGISFDISDLDPGFYIVEISNQENYRRSVKILKL